jgi:hypothetical protein
VASDEGAGSKRTDSGEEYPDERGVDWDALLAQLSDQPPEEGWVTLGEAASASGVSLSTLRSWYRSSRIPSRMVAGAHGPQRLVPLDSVLEVALRSSRARRQLEQARSLEAEVEELRARIEAIERRLAAGA